MGQLVAMYLLYGHLIQKKHVPFLKLHNFSCCSLRRYSRHLGSKEREAVGGL